MPIFSDLSNISHYYSGGASSLNYLSGPYAGHSSIVAANYRTPPPTFSKPSSRLLSRGYKPHLATITENNQLARTGVSRINSPKLLFHSSPKYKIQKPISINTADIDVSSNRYRRNYDRPKVLSPRSSAITTTTSNRVTKSPEKIITYSPREPSKDEEDSEEMFMPRIDQNFRTTIKRERTVVRLHTIRNLDEGLDSERNEVDESPTKRERKLEDKKMETVKVFDEEIQKTIPKWRENFEPEELTPNRRRREPAPQKPLSEKYVEKFLIKDKQDEPENMFFLSNKGLENNNMVEEILVEAEPKTNNISRRNSTRKSQSNVQSFHEEENDSKETETYNISRRNSIRQSLPKVQSFHEEQNDSIEPEIHNISRRNSTKQSLPKVQSFHEICKTISSDKIEEDLNPGQHPIVRRNTRKQSNYDIMKAIRRNSAEVNHEEIKLLDELIKGENLDTKQNSETVKQNIENEDPQESDVKKRKKFTKKKSNEKLVEDEEKEDKTTPQRRKIVKKKTTGSLDKAIEAITPKDSSEVKKNIPKITGTVEIETIPNLKLVVDTIHVEETILSSCSSPTTKKFKYNVIVEEIISPSIEKTEKLSNFSLETKKDIKTNEKEINKDNEKTATLQAIKKEPIKTDVITKPEEKKEKLLVTEKKEETENVQTKAEQEKQKMLDKILTSKKEPAPIPKKEEETNNLIAKKEPIVDGKTKAEQEKQKMLDKIMSSKKEEVDGNTKAEQEKQKMLDKILTSKREPAPIPKKEEEKSNLIAKKEPIVDGNTKAEQEKQKMLDMLVGKKTLAVEQNKEGVKIEPLADAKKKAEREKQLMLDKLIGKKETALEPKKMESPADAKTKAEQEKQKMLDTILGKKSSTNDEENTLSKAEEEKQKMLDKIMGKKESAIDITSKAENNKYLVNKKNITDDKEKIKATDKFTETSQITKTKSNEEIKTKSPITSLIKEAQKSSSQTDVPHKISSQEPIPDPKSKTSLATKRKTLQKQENEDELTSDNFWDLIGKRETIYYQNRRKYLEEKRQQDNKALCWSPEDEKEDNEAPSYPYAINAEVIAKSKASDARLRQKLAEMELSNSLEKKVEETKLNEIIEPVADKQNITIKKPEIKQSSSNTEILKKPELLKKSSTEVLSNNNKTAEIKKVENKSSKIIEPVEDKQKTEIKKPDANINNKTNVEILKKSELKKSSTEILTNNKTAEVKKVENKIEDNKSNKTIEQKTPMKKTDVVINNKTNPEILKKPELKKSSTEVLNKTVEIKKIEPVVKKTVEAVVPPKKQKVSKFPQKVKNSNINVRPQNSVKTDNQKRAPKLSVKQKSEEKIEKKIRPRLQRQSKSLEHLNKEKIKLTPVQIAEMKAIVRDIQLEPLKPELDFIIQEEYNPALKPNEDLVVPTVSQYKKIKPQLEELDKKKRGEEEEETKKLDNFLPLQSNPPALPEPKPKAKPKWFDECPVVIMATPRDLRTRNPIHRRKPEPQPVPKVTYVSDSDDSDDSDDTNTSSSSSGGSDEYETNIVFNHNQTNKWKSTSSNDSGFDSSAPGSPANNRNRTDASSSTTSMSNSSSESPSITPATNPAFTLEPMEASSAYTAFQRSGRVTPPATSIPRFRKYMVEDFCFLKVLGKGSFGKVLLAELRNTEYYYAVKCLKKDIVLEDDDVECTLIERKVLALGTKHPYLCHLFCTFQTESHLFFVMEYLNGGDLMFHIQVSGRFPEPRAKFYGAEIVSGLKFLHSKGIVYRDLKLDNILLDFDGHVRIADFGMCKLQIFLDRTADTFCGTPDYMAPEIIKGQHYNQGVDWWSFGVLLYEMLIGQSPFSGCDEDELFWSICNERPVIPGFLSQEASQILTLLLEKDSAKRLGNKYCIAGDIIDQPFFKSIDWGKLELRQLEAPFRPKVQHPLDTQYFDKAFTAEKVKLTPIEKDILHSMDQTQFHGFSYTNPNATDK